MKKINLKIKGVDLNLYDLARLSVLSMFTLLTFNVLGKQFPNQVHEISKSTKNEEEMDIIKIDLNKLSRSNWTAQERKNAEVVVDFVQHLMNNHDFDYVKEKFGKNPYIQHNRGMEDGMVGVIDFVSKFAKRYPEYSYDVKHIYVDGNHVIFQSHVTIKKKHRGNANKGLNIKDTWKVEDGKIVEHWDAIQAVDGFMRFYAWMAGGKIKNTNTLY